MPRLLRWRIGPRCSAFLPMERISNLLQRLKRKARAGQTVEDALESAFRSFDTDRDGMLRFGEFNHGTRAAQRGAR